MTEIATNGKATPRLGMLLDELERVLPPALMDPAFSSHWGSLNRRLYRLMAVLASGAKRETSAAPLGRQADSELLC